LEWQQCSTKNDIAVEPEHRLTFLTERRSLLYPDETVRLLQAVPAMELDRDAEGTVERVVRDDDGRISSAEVRFYLRSGAKVVALPLDALEPVISSSIQQRTAVLWGISVAPERLIETAMHSILDRGFLMRDGLNVARLYYDAPEHWWKWGERISDPAGAQTVVAAPAWDGCVVAFSGRQRFQLEFRLRCRGGPCLLLHEREAAYSLQARETPPAMSLARVLMNLYMAVDAQFCAFPVATAWLLDEDWQSLLRPPYYPDLFLLPDTAPADDYPPSFRVQPLTRNRVMMTGLPIKFAPVDDPIKRTERELKLDSLRRCHALGEKYYDQLYETRFNPSGLYSSIKDAFLDAISLANEMGMKEEAGKLEQRLEHIKAVFRSQFS
jgi:hypothetical protein